MHALALRGFEELVRCGEIGSTGFELFGEAFRGARWAYSMMRRLAERGVVRAHREEGRGLFGRVATVFRTTQELTELVETGNVSSLVWQGATALPLQRESLQEELPVAAPPGDPDSGDEEPAPAEDPLDDVPEEDDIDAQEALKALLKMMSVLVERLVALGDDMAALRGEVSDLKKSWE